MRDTHYCTVHIAVVVLVALEACAAYAAYAACVSDEVAAVLVAVYAAEFAVAAL